MKNNNSSTYLERKAKIMNEKSNQSLRELVIETSITIEEFISVTLGYILNIDWKTSKSLGYQSSSLSFHQKIQLFQDLKGIDKDMIKKLDYIMSIRNKFAHVGEVKTFNDFFKIAKDGEKIKNDLNKWYSAPYADKHDVLYQIFYLKLVREVLSYINSIAQKHGQDLTETREINY